MDDYTAGQTQLGMLLPEARAAMTNSFPKTTLRAARKRLENSASPAEQKVLRQWVARYEAREEAKRQHQYRQGVNGDAERAAETALRLREKQAEVIEAATDAERGRISSEQLRQAILEADRAAQKARALAESMNSLFDYREQLKAADLADLQDEELERFPVMADRLPTLLGEFAETGARALSAGYQRPANTNPSASVQGHADELFGAVRDAARSLEATEARERLLAGPVTNDAAERIPAMGTRR